MSERNDDQHVLSGSQRVAVIIVGVLTIVVLLLVLAIYDRFVRRDSSLASVTQGSRDGLLGAPIPSPSVFPVKHAGTDGQSVTSPEQCSPVNTNDWETFVSSDGVFSLEYPSTLELFTVARSVPAELRIASARGSMTLRATDNTHSSTLLDAFLYEYGRQPNTGCAVGNVLPDTLGSVLGGVEAHTIVPDGDDAVCRDGDAAALFALSSDKRYLIELRIEGEPHRELFQSVLATLRIHPEGRE